MGTHSYASSSSPPPPHLADARSCHHNQLLSSWRSEITNARQASGVLPPPPILPCVHNHPSPAPGSQAHSCVERAFVSLHLPVEPPGSPSLPQQEVLWECGVSQCQGARGNPTVAAPCGPLTAHCEGGCHVNVAAHSAGQGLGLVGLRRTAHAMEGEWQPELGGLAQERGCALQGGCPGGAGGLICNIMQA